MLARMPPLFAAALIVLFEIIALGAIFPVLAKYGIELGAAPAAIGWWTGIIFFLRTSPKIVMNPLWGRLSDRIGRRGSLMIATGGSIVGSILWALSENGWGGSGLIWLLVSQGFVGVFGSQAALVYAVASDVTTTEKRAAALGLLGAAFGMGFIVGPALGGVIGESLSFADVGWFCAVLQVLSLGVTLFVLRETRPDNHDAHSDFYQPTRLRQLAMRPHVFKLLCVVIVATVGLSMMLPTFEKLTVLWYEFDARHTGYAFSVFGLAGIIVQGGLIRPMIARCGEKPLFVFGSALLAGGFFLLGMHPETAWFWVAVVLIGLGAGFSQPTMTAMVSHLVDQSEQGAIHGLNQGATSLGRGLGYLMGGGLLAMVGPAMPYRTAAGIVILSALMIFVVKSKRDESSLSK